MRLPTPPFPTLSASGAAAIWETDDGAGLLDLGATTIAPEESWVDVAGVAVSPSGVMVALAGDDHVRVVSKADGWSVVARHAVDEPPFRMALGDDGLLVMAMCDEDDVSTIVIADGDARHEAPLGDAAVFTLLLDQERARVLAAGRSGHGAFQGGGDDFVRLLERDMFDGTWSVIWEGPAPIDTPNGWVMPLASGEIGVYSPARFMVLSPDINPDDVGTVVDSYDWDHLETVAVSPDGRWIAWFWRGDSDDSCHVRAVRVADGTVMDHPDTDGPAQFPTIAIDGNGDVTLVDVVRPADVRVRWLAGGTVTTATYTVDP